MPRRSLFIALLTLAPASAQTLSRQAAPLPYVTLSAPGYAVRAEVRPAVTYPESGPNVGPYFQFSPAQVRIVLDKVGMAKWKSQHAADMPPAYVTVTPVANWLSLYKGAEMRTEVSRQLANLRDLNTERVQSSTLQAQWKLPYLPLVNATQAVTGAVKRVNTPQLQGVRYLAIYAQETSTQYQRGAVFYTFQGLSRDSKQMISVRLPYTPTSFPQEVAGSTTMQNSEWQQYRAQAQAKLDAESTKLAALDRLVQSIRIR